MFKFLSQLSQTPIHGLIIDNTISPRHPKKGEMWLFINDNPFKMNTVLIKEIRSGWVNYRMSCIFDDESCSIETFIRMYKFYKDVAGDSESNTAISRLPSEQAIDGKPPQQTDGA